MSGKRFDLAVRLFLAAAVFLVYGQVWTHEFLNFDDDQYVTRNPYVVRGLTIDGLGWAFTGIHSANWHPLTTLTHMLDAELFGLNAGAHLLVNVALHAAASIVLYEILARSTARRGASAFVAALFALHPLRVESVAWVSERKDVLSVLLAMLAIAAYVAYARRPSLARYATVGVLFALGLLAKPMLVTLPFVLLLLDYWPLGRAARALDRRVAGTPTTSAARRCELTFGRLVLEKLPLILLAVAASGVTIFVQGRAGAVVSMESLPMPMRVENALVAYASYLLATIWPIHLAVFYPLRVPIGWQVALSAVVLVAVTAGVLVARERRPYLFTGWLWYVGTLVPVIGLVHVGDQAMADRYTYLPSIGLYVMAAWSAADAPARLRRALSIAGAALVAAAAALAWVQVGYWRDSETLFRRALAVTEENHVAHGNLGAVLLEDGRAEEALEHFEAAVRLRPDRVQARTNIGIARGIVLAKRGDAAQAAERYAEVLRLDPSNAMAQFNWGVLLAQQGKLEDAAERYVAAIELVPGYANAHNNLGLVRAHQGRLPEAIEQYRRAIELAPHLAAAHGNLGVALESSGDAAGALTAYRELVRLEPDDPRARYNLAALLAELGKREEAIAEFRRALVLEPGWKPAEEGLANLLGAGSR